MIPELELRLLLGERLRLVVVFGAIVEQDKEESEDLIVRGVRKSVMLVVVAVFAGNYCGVPYPV